MRMLVATAPVRSAAAARIRWLAERADPERLADEALRQSLLPLVAMRLDEVAPELLLDSLRPKAAAITRETRHLCVAVEVVTERLTSALEQSGVPAVVLKGPNMARELYGDLGLRVTTDIDLLVRPSAFSTALEVLTANGYEAEPIDDWGDGLPLFEVTLRAATEWSPVVDLHWQLRWDDDGLSPAVLARSLPPDGQRPRRLAPLDLLTTLYLIYARDGFWGLRTAADLAAWWDRYAAILPGDVLSSVLRAHPSLEESLVAAARVAERLVGVPADRTVPGRTPRRRATRRAVRLANWNGAVDASRMYATRTLSDVLVSPRSARWRAVTRQLWPPATVVARTYERWVRRGAPLTALRLYYAVNVCCMFVPTQLRLLWRTRHGRHLCA